MINYAIMAKMLSIRFDDAQAEQLKQLAGQMHNTEAGVVRLAVDTLFKECAGNADGDGKSGKKRTFALATSAMG